MYNLIVKLIQCLQGDVVKDAVKEKYELITVDEINNRIIGGSVVWVGYKFPFGVEPDMFPKYSVFSNCYFTGSLTKQDVIDA